ncbi:MAG: U32 family peptidase [Bacteroidaceae bacterium]|nr:U32 family peptidase [Bacteroidaceae bacterium]
MTKLELLSPARTADIGIEAIRHGADAVYIGAPRFGARAAAGNSVEDIGRLVQYAHQFGAKIYVTINTLLRDDELDDVQQLISQLYDIDVDALIVQDLRLLSLDLPPIPLHASTQMDNRTPEHVQQLYDMGFRQVVLARELTIDQIRRIHQACPDMKLECFVHGALCVSLSGRCYASEFLFGRSANRGECAQVCRMEFDLIEQHRQGDHVEERVLMQGKHLLSLKDLCLIHHLGEMIEAGVSSFKIEGRLKDMAYVKNVTAAYSEQLNSIVDASPSAYERLSHGKVELLFTPDVHKSFNRGFTDYFLHGRNAGIFSFDTPKALGEEVGTVKEVFTNSFSVAGLHQFANGDGLCFFDHKGRLHGFRLNKVSDGRLYPLNMPRELQPKQTLYRNFDKRFDDLLSRNSAERYMPIAMSLSETADGFRLTACDDQGNTAHYDATCDKQLAHTHQHENIQRQLSKLGDTPYRLSNLDITLAKNWFIPASWLASWRRAVVEQLQSSQNLGHTDALVAAASGHSATSGHSSTPGHSATSYAVADKSAHIQPPAGSCREVSQDIRLQPSTPLMTCRHCLRYSLGWCHRADTPALLLRLANGTRFKLQFDCKRCVMQVLRLLLIVPLLCSCSRPAVNALPADVQSADTLLLLTQAQADSLNFRLSHHYTNNFNFVVKTDSLPLLTSEPILSSQNAEQKPEDAYTYVVRGDIVAVANIIMNGDTAMIKVARDQITMGWIPEPQLLAGTTPNDTISILIDRLARYRFLWMTVMALFSLLCLRMRAKGQGRISKSFDTFYPSLLIMLVSVMACLYASIQMWAPEFWQEYYFHPTFNPLNLPPALAALVSLVWLIVVVMLALMLEVYKHLDFMDGLRLMMQTLGLSMLAYLLVAFTTRIYIGYIILPVIITLLTIHVVKSTKHINYINHSSKPIVNNHET